MKFKNIAVVMLSLGAVSCGAGQTKTQDAAAADTVQVVEKMTDVVFDGDTAYKYVKTQVDFGPRIPGWEGHTKCQKFLVGELRRHGAEVIEQRAVIENYKHEKYPINNIMGRYNTAAQKRVLLLAHWDTRPWADNDPSRDNRDSPVPGANDGGSGVGVLLEVARQLGKKAPAIGVDILFVDAEDSGQSSGWGSGGDTWCLGTQYWVENMPYEAGRLPQYAILLDMVGGQNVRFTREFYSEKYASWVIDKVWSVAARSGYGTRFVNESSGAVMDDHYFVNKAGIPCIDIIECDNPVTKNFHPAWHTVGDNMSIIDQRSLQEVGQVVINTLYTEPVQ